jgi:hypothetical protein
MSDDAKFLVSYYAAGQAIWQDEYAPMVPTVGSGVYLKGQAYRVTDVWLNYEKHAPVGQGIAVFMEEDVLGSGFFDVANEYYSG